MKRLRITLLLGFIAGLILLFAGCGTDTSKLEGYVSVMEESSAKCAAVQADLEVKDGDTVVYGYTRRLERNGENFSVTETERRLNDFFELGESTETSVIPATNAVVLPVSLTGSNLAEYSIKDGVLTATVNSADAMNAVFKMKQFSMKGSASVECKLVKKKISEINVSYKTAEDRQVTVKIGYTY